jgi:hypothetical protein
MNDESRSEQEACRAEVLRIKTRKMQEWRVSVCYRRLRALDIPTETGDVTDLTEMLGVYLHEAVQAGEGIDAVKSDLPAYIEKTDEESVQNLK